MSKALKQFLTVQAALNTNLPLGFFERIDTDLLQRIVGDPQTAGRHFARFLENGARVDAPPNILKIDRRKPFNPSDVSFPCSGLISDPKSLALKKVDLNEVEFVTFASEDEKPTGRDTIERLRTEGHIPLDAAVGLALRGAPHAAFQGKWRSDVRIYFDGTVITAKGQQYSLYIDWYRASGSPNWVFSPIDNVRPANWVSATLPPEEA